jgi:hypothetical protein
MVRPDDVAAIVGDALWLPVKSKSNGLSLMMMTPPLVGAGWP